MLSLLNWLCWFCGVWVGGTVLVSCCGGLSFVSFGSPVVVSLLVMEIGMMSGGLLCVVVFVCSWKLLCEWSRP